MCACEGAIRLPIRVRNHTFSANAIDRERFGQFRSGRETRVDRALEVGAEVVAIRVEVEAGLQ
jgi:hypothetical protein